MWVFLNDAFLSIVDESAKKLRMRNRAPSLDDPLLVRARVKGDIERVFPGTRVVENEATDYRFRAVVRRSDVAQAIYDEAMRIDYGNFKASVEEDDRHDVYAEVWNAHFRWQSRTARFGRQRQSLGSGPLPGELLGEGPSPGARKPRAGVPLASPTPHKTSPAPGRTKPRKA
jgi:hypothetical protein